MCCAHTARRTVVTTTVAFSGSKDALQQALDRALGDAPRYDPSRQHAHDYLLDLLAWGTGPSAPLPADCLSRQGDNRHARLDAASLQAAGCYPGFWQAPLRQADVWLANKEAAAGRLEVVVPQDEAPPRGRRPGQRARAKRRAMGRGMFSLLNGWWQRPLNETACMLQSGYVTMPGTGLPKRTLGGHAQPAGGLVLPAAVLAIWCIPSLCACRVRV
jgi:hypothetical protein